MNYLRKLSIGLSVVALVVLVLTGSTYLAIAQDTNTGGPAVLAPGGLVPSEVIPASNGIIVDMSPGTGAPPSTLGGLPMAPVPYPGAPGCTGITPPLPVGDGGAIGISPWDSGSGSRCIGSGWATWSHGYTGDVYFTGGPTSQVLSLPSNTRAVYFYVEPNPWSVQSFEAIAQPGDISTGAFSVDGYAGATYVGFYATGSDTIQSITITCSTDFATGEFGWSGGGVEECVEDDTGALDIVGKKGRPGGSVAIPVRIQDAPNDVASLGFEVVFPDWVLSFTGYTIPAGSLVEYFDFFDCVIPTGETNIVRCGGFKSEGGIGAGSSGDVVSLEFDVSPQCDEIAKLDLQELKDDIAGWSASHGCFDCTACDCDVNGDGEITPQDAMCAFQKYLGICPTACGPCEEVCCDVTGDGECTPQDALEIFREYLGLPSICSEPVPECTPPPYNPEKWNDGGEIQHNNNCYNFANDEITMTFAQPGRWCGDMYSSLTCEEVHPAAACDGLVPSDAISPCPDNMHKVYLVVWPGRDYHWYRHDTGGMWSHKPGSTPATDRDASGLPISNPETADTGPYTAHCGYMCACGDNATIR